MCSPYFLYDPFLLQISELPMQIVEEVTLSRPRFARRLLARFLYQWGQGDGGDHDDDRRR